MKTTKSNSINKNARFCIQSLYQDRQRQLFSYKIVQAKDLSPSTAIPTNPSAKIQDLSNVLKYSGYHTIENLIIHEGHNNIDSGNSSFGTANIVMESASEIKKNLTSQSCNL